MRSSIKTRFAYFKEKFAFFAPDMTHQETEVVAFNRRFKLAVVLMNIMNCVDKFNIEIQPHHIWW